MYLYSNLMLFWIVPLGGCLAVGLSLWMLGEVNSRPEGTDRMKLVAGLVKDGASAYLKRQHRASAGIFAVLVLLLTVLAICRFLNPFVPLAFLTGGLLSALCGYLGLTAACGASSRTAWALRESLAGGVQLGVRAGSVLGLAVAGFGLLDLSLWYYVLNVIYDHNFFGLGLDLAVKAGLAGEEFSALWLSDSIFLRAKGLEIASTMLTFGLGASIYALFARMGGGIFAKAADLGADLVGSGDFGIPHDDARNPAAIAGRVGENVGSVAGLGADLYSSFVCSILAASTLGAAILAGREGDIPLSGTELGPVLAPMLVAAIGCILSGMGILSVRIGSDFTRRGMLASLGSTLLIPAALMVGAVWVFCQWLGLERGSGLSILAGLSAGLILAQIQRCFTTNGNRPSHQVARSAKMGPAAAVLEGLSVGMLSTCFPALVVGASILLSFACSGGFHDLSLGLHGVSLSAVGMLSMVASSLSLGAYGPIAGNAGANASMAHLDPEIRERAEILASLGKTTAAMGRRFAIGAACLTGMALLAAYAETARMWSGRLNHAMSNTGLADMVTALDLNLVNPRLIVGLLLGAIMIFLFSALTMKAVGRAAGRMVEEVKRQFMEIEGLLEGEASPDYDACVSLSADGAQKEMLLPVALALSVPTLAGLLLGVAGVFGLLMGSLVTGFVMALMLDSAGDVWDRARIFVEKGNFGGKGSDVHRACIIGATLGESFKDAVGPSLASLLKLMSMVSIVSAALVIAMQR